MEGMTSVPDSFLLGCQTACCLSERSQFWAVLRAQSGKQVEWEVSLTCHLKYRVSVFMTHYVTTEIWLKGNSSSWLISISFFFFFWQFLACIIPELTVFVWFLEHIDCIRSWIILHRKSSNPIIPKGYSNRKERFQDETKGFSKKKKKRLAKMCQPGLSYKPSITENPVPLSWIIHVCLCVPIYLDRGEWILNKKLLCSRSWTTNIMYCLLFKFT